MIKSLTAGLMALALSACNATGYYTGQYNDFSTNNYGKIAQRYHYDYVELHGPPYKLWNNRTCWSPEQCAYRDNLPPARYR